MSIAKEIIKLFILLFRCCLFCITNKYSKFPKIFVILLQNQRYRRYFEERRIKDPFLPHEKQAVHECLSRDKSLARLFTAASPKTVLTLWHNAIAHFWSYKKLKPGRPPITRTVKELILKLKKENFLWGARRIRDELLKLSITVSHEAISKILGHFRKTGDLQPNLTWKRFLKSHWDSLFACDFFTETIFGMKTFYVFFIMELKTRKIVQYCCTDHPNMAFLRNQLSYFSDQHPDSYLIHDNSGELKWFPYNQYDIKDVGIVPYSPNMNAYAERFVRSIRKECLDYFIIFTYGQLHRVVTSYIDYYNNYRPHQGIRGIPNGPPETGGAGPVRKRPLLFGLHNHYYREAA
jgi:transposase InsO family protein